MKLWPTFNKAADAVSAWREAQKAALNRQQRSDYEGLARAGKEREGRKIAEQEEARQRLVEEERRRLMARKPELALRMLPARPIRESRAWFLARRIVRERQAIELQTLRQREEERLDQFLAGAAKERERPASLRQEFEKTSFEPIDRTAQLDEALRARAAQRQRDRDRNRGEGGRER